MELGERREDRRETDRGAAGSNKGGRSNTVTPPRAETERRREGSAADGAPAHAGWARVKPGG